VDVSGVAEVKSGPRKQYGEVISVELLSKVLGEALGWPDGTWIVDIVRTPVNAIRGTFTIIVHNEVFPEVIENSEVASLY
jgi:hypothetical protein